jgi:hypothetical protein
MIGLIVLVFLGAVAAVIIAHVRERRSIEAAARFANDLTAKEIERNISADVASKNRPYQPGTFGNDEGGRSYVAGMDGAVRRVHIVPTEDGGETLLMHRKLGKAERKKRKKAIRMERERAHRADHGPLAIDGACDVAKCEYAGPTVPTTDNRSKADCERRDAWPLQPAVIVVGPNDAEAMARRLGLRPIITNVSAE